MRILGWLAGLSLAWVTPVAARPAEPLTYLLPAPKEAIAFAPFVLADHLGFYAAEGLSVRFVTIAGGAKVGEALARGEGDLGGASGDTPILLRDRGVAVKGVALLGGGAFLTLISDRATTVAGPALKGRAIGVPSLTDVSTYALEAMIAAAGLVPGDVDVQAKPPADLWRALGERRLDAIVGTVDWGVRAERAGVPLDYVGVDRFYPAMAQAILASDSEIAAHPARIRGFVRATLKAVAWIRRDPVGAAGAYRAAMPAADLSDAEIARVFTLLSRHVYAGQRTPGAFDRHVVARMRDAYVARGLVAAARPAGTFYTNRFVR